MAWFSVYPTCDIHLVRTNGSPVDVEVVDWPGTNVVSSPDTTWADFDAAIVSISKVGNTIRFQPVADGVSIGRIKNSTTDNFEMLVRVTVHESIQSFWIGNNNATIHEGESNYVLSVFAKFNDNTIGDVTSHPFIDFNITTPAPLGNSLTIDNTNDKGRLTGVSDTSGATITVEVSHAALPAETISVIVREPLTQTRDLLDPVRLNGLPTEKRNILILPDGFEDTVADRAMFNRAVRELNQGLFDTNQQTPYDILKDSFNVWKAFIPSAESGVTIRSPLANDGRPIPSRLPDAIRDRVCDSDKYSGRQLIELVGIPGNSPPANLADATTTWSAEYGGIGFDPSKIDQPIFNHWVTQEAFGLAQAKDSFFGLAIGERYGFRYAKKSPEKKNSFYLTGAPARTISPDLRRMKKNGVRESDYFYHKFLSSLRLRSGSSTDPNKDVYKSWVDTSSGFTNGKDYTLVCFIAKDHFLAGTNWGPLFITLGSTRKHPILINNSKISHSPALTFISGNTGSINIAEKTAVLAHEYGHSLRLLDEYEGYDDPNHTSFPNNQSEKNGFKDWGWNLTHFFDIQRPNPNPDDLIDATKIPWNWHRISKAAISVNPAFNQGSSQIVIRMKPGEGANWQNEKNNNVEIFLRHPELNRDANDRTKRIEGPLTIHSITPNSTSGDVFVLNGRTRTITGSNPYPEGSILFVPLRDIGDNILTTIDPAVVTYINDLTPGMGEGKPFMKKTNCDSCNSAIGYPPNNISGFSYPANRFEVIGLYEGAGTYNCKAYRSAGVCLMRQGKVTDSSGNERQARFSFITKYIIVSVIDPTKLPLINNQYPT